jgi:hypothetical protein
LLFQVALEATMKTLILSAVAAVTVALVAPRAEAKLAAVYASGHAGMQNEGTNDPGFGFMLGGRVLIFDGYADYTRFNQYESVSRGILGLRGGFGERLRLVLRAGVGGIREEGGALTGPMGVPGRTGGVARAGAAVEAAINPLLYLGFGFDTEHYRFPGNTLGIPSEGSDVFAALRATFELGI